MANIILSPNMSLPIPVTGVDPGPDWANNLNACQGIVDGHDHTTGKGVPIPAGGINLGSDLPFNKNNATLLRSVNFNAQLSPLALPTDIGCVYVSGIDLYYNDEIGRQIQITSGGNVNSGAGSISGLTSPAAASYISGSQTFFWQSNSGSIIAANMDFRNAIFNNATASSHKLTLSPPLAMSSDYALTLPSLPIVTGIMTLDTSGNMGASLAVDNATIVISSNTLEVPALGIGTAQLQDGSVTPVKRSALGQQTSSSTGVLFSTTSSSFVDVTGLSLSITTTGRPVFVGLMFANPSIPPVGVDGYVSITSGQGALDIVRGSTHISESGVGGAATVPISSVWYIDAVGAGTYTYKIQAISLSGGTLSISGAQLIAYEL